MLIRVALLSMMTLALGGFGLVAWISLKPPPPAAVADAPAPPPPPVLRAVLAAASSLRPGVLLKPEDLVALQVTETDAPEGARPDTVQARSELIGAMLRRAVGEKQPVLPADVLRPGDHGFLAAVLRPGMRATTVGVDAVSGTAGLIWPGDRVDLVLTQALDDQALPQGRRVLGETVMSDLRVIAIDQQLMQGAVPGSSNADSNRTVTLEATPAQVERVAVATRLGKLSLAVRPGGTAQADAAASGPDKDSAKDGAKAGVPQLAVSTTTWGADVSPGLVQQRPGTTGTLRVFQGTTEGKEYKFP